MVDGVRTMLRSPVRFGIKRFSVNPTLNSLIYVNYAKTTILLIIMIVIMMIIIILIITMVIVMIKIIT